MFGEVGGIESQKSSIGRLAKGSLADWVPLHLPAVGCDGEIPVVCTVGCASRLGERTGISQTKSKEETRARACIAWEREMHSKPKGAEARIHP